MQFETNPRIVVVGLGYVGLPLAVALSGSFRVTGFDIDESRIRELRNDFDRTNEVSKDRLSACELQVSSEMKDVSGADVYIVTVPTPIDERNQPDLGPLLAATRSVAEMIDPARPTVVVYESTVYPGVTEDICGPLLEEGRLKRGINFWLGYSPERINPGDREHTIDRIVKVVAGENPKVTKYLGEIYARITSAGVFAAASITVAEAAKVIENAQRDINIAFMNEVAMIFSKIGISIWDVLDAATTKWNFLPFQPGLVGGHCIGVDPYYLSYLSQRVGHEPEAILAGRRINDSMGEWVADEINGRAVTRPSRVLILGATFKENVPDLRNSKVADLVRAFQRQGHHVTLHDPIADESEVVREHGIEITADALDYSYDIVVGAVAHDQYRGLDEEQLGKLLNHHGLLADLKGMWRSRPYGPFNRWCL